MTKRPSPYTQRDVEEQTSINSPETILVIPGGEYQISLIKKAQARGYIVACADRDSECQGAKAADIFYRIGLDERELLLRLAKDIQPKAILTDQTDAAVRVVAWLNDMLCLRGIGVDVARLFTNKILMREFSACNGFNKPRFLECNDVHIASKAAENMGYPVIIKPVDAQSSKGVFKVNSTAELSLFFGSALIESSEKMIVVEEFLHGTEFTIEGVMTSEGHRSLAISQKKHYKNAPMVASSLTFSNYSDVYDYDRLREVHDKWMNQSKLSFGITHAEYIHTGDDYTLVEVAARGGGTRISSDIVPFLSGIDCQELLIDLSLGFSHSNVPFILPNRHGLLEFFEFSPGRVLEINGLSAAKKMAGIKDLVLGFGIGDTLVSPSNDRQRPGYFIACCDTASDLAMLRSAVLKTLNVVVSQ